MNIKKLISFSLAFIILVSFNVSVFAMDNGIIDKNSNQVVIRGTYTIAGDGVRLRRRPKDGSVVGLLYRGDTVYGIYELIDIDNVWWAQVYSPKHDFLGWVAAEYLTR